MRHICKFIIFMFGWSTFAWKSVKMSWDHNVEGFSSSLLGAKTLFCKGKKSIGYNQQQTEK